MSKQEVKHKCSKCGVTFYAEQTDEKEKLSICPACQKKQKQQALLNIRNLLADEITRLSDFSSKQTYLQYFDEITYLNDNEKQLRVTMAVEFEAIIIQFFNVQKQMVKKKKYDNYDWIAMLASLYKKYYSRYTDIEWAGNHTREFAEQIQSTTDKAIKSATKQSGGNLSDDKQSNDGQSPGTSGGLQYNSTTCFSKKRVRNIVKNEICILANAMRHEDLKKSGQKTHTWMTFRDEKVRATHRLADMQTKPIDEPFIIGGFGMMFPGDSSLGAPPQEIINCRCFEK